MIEFLTPEQCVDIVKRDPLELAEAWLHDDGVTAFQAINALRIEVMRLRSVVDGKQIDGWIVSEETAGVGQGQVFCFKTGPVGSWWPDAEPAILTRITSAKNGWWK